MARTEQDSAGTAGSGLDRLREELTQFLGAQLERLAEKAGAKLTDITGQLTDSAASGSLPKIGSRVLQGESPLKAFVGEKAKGAKDSLVGKVKGAFGGGGKGGRKSGDKKVTSIIEVLDIGVPLRTAYDHWTQYEKFSGFTKGVRDVSKTDEMNSNWKVKVGPSTRSWRATVQEQVPDERIVWTSEGAKGTTRGAVSFHELGPNLTRIVLVVEYYPGGFFEKTGNLWRAQGRRLRLDFKHFQRHVTLTDEEPEGWRGEIRDGEVVRSHDEAVEEEEAAQREEEEEGEGEEEGEEEGEYGEAEEAAPEEEEEEEEEGEEPEAGGGEEEEGYPEDEEEDWEEEEEEPEEEEPEAEERPGRRGRVPR